MPLFKFEKLHHPYLLGTVSVICAIVLSKGFKQLPNGTFYHQGMLDGSTYISEGQINSSGNSVALPTLARQNQIAPLFLPEGRVLPITINKGLFDVPKIEVPKFDLNAPVFQIDSKTGKIEEPNKKDFILTNNISILGQSNTLKFGTEDGKLTLVTPLPKFNEPVISVVFDRSKKIIQFNLLQKVQKKKPGDKTTLVKEFGDKTTLVKLLLQASNQDNDFKSYTMIRRPANKKNPDLSTPLPFSVK